MICLASTAFKKKSKVNALGPLHLATGSTTPYYPYPTFSHIHNPCPGGTTQKPCLSRSGKHRPVVSGALVPRKGVVVRQPPTPACSRVDSHSVDPFMLFINPGSIPLPPGPSLSQRRVLGKFIYKLGLKCQATEPHPHPAPWQSGRQSPEELGWTSCRLGSPLSPTPSVHPDVLSNHPPSPLF